jgi:hypothetical protein
VFARGAYLGLDGDDDPAAVTLYYDPILDVHHRVPTFTALINTLYLAPQDPDDGRRLFEAAAGQAGILAGDGPIVGWSPRVTGIAWLLARDWGLDDLAARLEAGAERDYEPTWDGDEFWWGFGLDEPHPRGQFNAVMAAAEATAPGAWTRLGGEYERYDGPEVHGIDLDAVAVTQATWDGEQLLVGLTPATPERAGEPTSFVVTGLGPDRVIEATVEPVALAIRP